MLWTIVTVVISFFAVIGIMEVLMCVLEGYSMRKIKSMQDICLSITLAGREEHLEFLLSSLSVMAERIAFRNLTTRLEIRDGGMDADTYERLRRYIEDNSNIYLIEKE